MHMLKKLEIQEVHLSLIKRVCDLEHSSLIRCHSKTEDEIDARADELNCDYITLKEFHHELSNAFYEFQLLYEEPSYLLEMETHYMSIFAKMLEIYHDTLSKEFPDVYPDFHEKISIYHALISESDNLSLN